MGVMSKTKNPQGSELCALAVGAEGRRTIMTMTVVTTAGLRRCPASTRARLQILLQLQALALVMSNLCRRSNRVQLQAPHNLFRTSPCHPPQSPNCSHRSHTNISAPQSHRCMCCTHKHHLLCAVPPHVSKQLHLRMVVTVLRTSCHAFSPSSLLQHLRHPTAREGSDVCWLSHFWDTLRSPKMCALCGYHSAQPKGRRAL